jgi:hypothetical protein
MRHLANTNERGTGVAYRSAVRESASSGSGRPSSGAIAEAEAPVKDAPFGRALSGGIDVI